MNSSYKVDWSAKHLKSYALSIFASSAEITDENCQHELAMHSELRKYCTESPEGESGRCKGQI